MLDKKSSYHLPTLSFALATIAIGILSEVEASLTITGSSVTASTPVKSFPTNPPQVPLILAQTPSIVGRWQSRTNHRAPVSGNYQIIITAIFHSDGSYEFKAFDTSDPRLSVLLNGQWKRSNNTIIATGSPLTSNKVYQHNFRIVNANTLVDSYGETFLRLP